MLASVEIFKPCVLQLTLCEFVPRILHPTKISWVIQNIIFLCSTVLINIF